ncbi:O-acetyl-ADP-ribose deacetylase (regulator of RNase III) [Amorphus suaedae]
MLIYRRTSILESNAQTLVNTVNCVGVMGKGLARSFKKREPRMFAAYQRICENKLLEPGKLWLWRESPNWVLNFPTKVHWRNPSRLEWIEAGLKKFASAYEGQGITEISFPRLGCGNGNLEWNDVRPLMEEYLGSLPIKVYIHDFSKDIGLPEHLENIAHGILSERTRENSFGGFLRVLKDVVSLAGGQLIEIDSKKPFSASITPSQGLKIEVGSRKWDFDEEALRGVWLQLQSGIVTCERAGWTEREVGPQLLSILSLMPNIRPIEIQRRGSANPEIAVELRPDRYDASLVSSHSPQSGLGWH